MILYHYRCPQCGKETDWPNEVKNRNHGPICNSHIVPHQMERVYVPLNTNMNGGGSRQTDPILQFQFEHLAHD